MDPNQLLEIVSVALSLTYLLLLIKENRWCWVFAFVAALLSVYIFVQAKLYSESVLYVAYALFSVYGWIKWAPTAERAKTAVQRLPVVQHLLWILVGLAGAWSLATLFATYTDAEKTSVDALTTSFSFVASYLQAHKYLYNWIYWIIINGVTVWLYVTQGLSIYAGLMVVYTAMSVVGLMRWQRTSANGPATA